MLNITPTQLRKAANLKEKIQELEKELGQILGATVEAAPTEAPKKRRMSAAGRRAIGAAAKARWAAIRARKAPKAPKKKRKMTAAWKAALAKAWEARRAKSKAASKS
jgi:hypothetical protein